MRCIFCKRDSSGSRSMEHIVPESLGNKHHTLPPGVVCDKCNNYFARKVEKPFLDTPALRSLRFHQAVPNKANRIPQTEAVIAPGAPTILRRLHDEPGFHVMGVSSAGFQQILADTDAGRQSYIAFPPPAAPSGPMVSRFLAKCALEALAKRFIPREGWNDEMLRPELDEIRRHAREGVPVDWPYHERRIYDAQRRIGEGV